MKKIYLLFIAIAMVAFCKESMAQAVTVTLEVDLHNFLNNGGVVAAAGMRVGGTFSTDSATTGGVSMANWSPLDTTGKMTNNGDSIWSITVTFAAAVVGVGDTLQFKFVDGDWGGTSGCTACTNEDYGTDVSLVTAGCSPATGSENNNRLLPIPTTSGLTYKWCYDSCVQCNGASPILSVQNIEKVSVFSLAPNPAVNKQSTLMYSVSQYSPVTIALYNMLGQQVKAIVNTNRPSGLYNQTIDLSDVSAGVYFIQLTSGNQTVAKKIVVN